MKSLMAASLAVTLCMCGSGWAKDRMAPIPKGVQVGVVNLLDAEVMHYHSASDAKDSFVKIRDVVWPVQDMLDEALTEPLEQLGLNLQPVAPSKSLTRARENCFVDQAPVKDVPRGCIPPLLETASTANVGYLIVLAPGLNNYEHAGNTRNDSVPETMRGWGLRSRDKAGDKDKPTVVNEVELVLLDVTSGKVVLRARQWGGVYSSRMDNFTLPPDPRQIPDEDLERLRPAFAAILARQAKAMLDQVQVGP